MEFLLVILARGCRAKNPGFSGPPGRQIRDSSRAPYTRTGMTQPIAPKQNRCNYLLQTSIGGPFFDIHATAELARRAGEGYVAHSAENRPLWTPCMVVLAVSATKDGERPLPGFRVSLIREIAKRSSSTIVAIRQLYRFLSQTVALVSDSDVLEKVLTRRFHKLEERPLLWLCENWL